MNVRGRANPITRLDPTDREANVSTVVADPKRTTEQSETQSYDQRPTRHGQRRRLRFGMERPKLEPSDRGRPTLIQSLCSNGTSQQHAEPTLANPKSARQFRGHTCGGVRHGELRFDVERAANYVFARGLHQLKHSQLSEL